MKKKIEILMIGLVLCFCYLFSGCSSGNFIIKNSKNVDEYKIEINIDEPNHTVSAKQSTNYINNTDTTLSFVCFHLYANSFSETASNKPVSVLYQSKAYPNGESYGKLVINSLQINNTEIEQIYEGTDKTILKVMLGKILYPNERITIDFDYTIILLNINHRFGYGDNTINLGNFYPIACVFEKDGFNESEYHYNGDPFYSNMANYFVTINNSKNYTVASTGNIINKTQQSDILTTEVEAKAVRDFDIILSDKFETTSQKVNATTINYFYYNDENVDLSLKTAVDALEAFSDLFGDYPYQVLNVVECNFMHGGMEYPNQVMISDSLEKYEDYQTIIIHEIAHQWWYGVVGNNEYNYGWLDEGLTEYSTALFYEANEEYNLSYSEIVKNANSSYCCFVEVYEDIFGKVNTSMNRKLDEYNTEPEYVYISYVKGMLLFDSVREIIGKNTLIKCLKSYYKKYQGKNATPDDLIGVFESVSLRNLESFFDSWINRTVVVAPKDSQQKNEDVNTSIIIS